MRRYGIVVRWVFATVFLGGGVAHLVQGRAAPEGYAVYGSTALWRPLEDLWEGFVMPHIAGLTLVLAAWELGVGVCLLLGGRSTRVAVVAILGFFAFLLVLGYGWPAASPVEDILKNRAFTVVMAGMLLPVLAQADPPGAFTRWGGRRRRASPAGRSRRWARR